MEPYSGCHQPNLLPFLFLFFVVVVRGIVPRCGSSVLDLTPFWWTPDIQPGWVGKKGNLPPCLGIPNSSNVMLWPSMKTMRTFHFTRLQQSLESIVPRFSPGFSNTAPANVPARRPCATTPRRRVLHSPLEPAGRRANQSKRIPVQTAKPRSFQRMRVVLKSSEESWGV